MEYIVAFILAFVGIFYNHKWTPTNRKVFMIVIWIYVVLLLGFRYRVGIDTISYMKAFRNTYTLETIFSHNLLKARYEPGYLLVCAFFRSISKEFWPLQMFLAAVTNGCVFIFLYRYCKNVFVGLLIFFVLQWLYLSTEVMRESVAIGIFLLNYRNIEKKRWIRYYLISLLSISFHYSAIIIWFIPFAKYIKFNYIFFLICIVFLFVTPIVEKLSEFISIPEISRRINQYIMMANTINLNWKLGELIRSALPALASIIAYHISKDKMQMQPMILLQLLFCAGAFAIPIIFSRFANYTSLFVTIVIANYICKYNVSALLKVAYICFVFLTQTIYYAGMYTTWFPYVSIFNTKQVQEREQRWKQEFGFSYR